MFSMTDCIICSAALCLLGIVLLILDATEKVVVCTGLAAIALSVLVLIFSLVRVMRHRKLVIEYLEDCVFCSDEVSKAAMMSFPEAFVIIDESGEVKWFNRKFAEIVRNSQILGEQIQNIIPELPFHKFIESNKAERDEINYDLRNYDVFGVPVISNIDTSKKLALYMFDITEEIEFKKQCKDKKTVECIMLIDNYDEAFRSARSAGQGALIMEIENAIEEWVRSGGGVIRRYEREKFIVFFEAGEFDKLVAKKFEILSRVRNFTSTSGFAITLSIGVGKDGGSLVENDKQARLALDMALGRGGDQAVIKSDEGYRFFGAKSSEVERSTKVKARVTAHVLKDLIERADNVVIMGHKGADMDSLGSAAALFKACEIIGTKAFLVLDRQNVSAKSLLEVLLKNHEYASGIVSGEKALGLVSKGTLLIILDTHRPCMVECPKLLDAVHDMALIDHHRRSEDFISDTLLSYHEPYASSTAEMVTELLQYMGDALRPSKIEAEALYSGIFMDTKGFTFKTGSRTFEAASYLRRIGINPIDVKRLFKSNLNMYVTKAKIISNAKIYRENIAISTYRGNSEETQIVVAQAADELLNITNIEASFVLAQCGNKIVISGRSLESVNVQVVLEKLGGGGHINIAGAQLDMNSLELAEQKLKSAIDEVLFD